MARTTKKKSSKKPSRKAKSATPFPVSLKELPVGSRPQVTPVAEYEMPCGQKVYVYDGPGGYPIITVPLSEFCELSRPGGLLLEYGDGGCDDMPEAIDSLLRFSDTSDKDDLFGENCVLIFDGENLKNLIGIALKHTKAANGG